MKARLLIASVAGVTALTVLACKDDTPLYPGGTAGSASTLNITRSALVMRQADTASIGAVLADSAGNPTAGDATIASCDATIATVTAGTAPAGSNGIALVTGKGVGHTCITVTAAGFVDTASVDVGPYLLTITGPAAAKSGIGGVNDRTGSKPYVYKVAAFDPAGVAITAPFFRTWTTQTNQALFLPLSKNGVADSVLVVSPGATGAIRVTVQALGGATATSAVAVGDGDFTGTVTAGNVLTRPGLDTIIITRNAAGGAASTSPLWNATAANQTYFFGTIQTFVRYQSVVSGGAQTYPTTPTNTTTANAVIVIPPLGIAAGTAVPLEIRAISSTSITQLTTAANNFVTQNSTGVDAGEPGNNAAATAATFTIPSCDATPGNVCGAAPPATFNLSPISLNYSILSGSCATGPANGPRTGGAGTDCDDWLLVTNGLATTRNVSINLAWFSNADVDIYVYDATGTTLQAAGQTRGGTSETIAFNLGPNQTFAVRANLFSQGTNAAVITGGAAGARATLVRWQMTVNGN